MYLLQGCVYLISSNSDRPGLRGSPITPAICEALRREGKLGKSPVSGSPFLQASYTIPMQGSKGVLWEWGSHYLRSPEFPSKSWEMVLKCYWCIKVYLRTTEVLFHSITLPMTHLVHHYCYSLKSRCLWLNYTWLQMVM